MFKVSKNKTKSKVNCTTYIENLSAVMIQILNALKVEDKEIDEKINEYKKLIRTIKYEENTDKLTKLRDSILDFVVEYDVYLNKKKQERDRLILGNINMLLTLAKSLESSEKWKKSLNNIKDILKEKIDIESLTKTKSILVNLGYSSKDTKDVIYRDMIDILFSLLEVESNSKDVKSYFDKYQKLKNRLNSNPYAFEDSEIRLKFKDLVEEKERLESEYIDSLHKKLNKALKALLYTIGTFSSASSNYVDTFQNHIDEINNTINNSEIDVDGLSKRLISIAIKIKDTTVNMKAELKKSQEKLEESRDAIERLKSQLNEAQQNLIIDPLTSAYNRRGMVHFMQVEIERSLRYKQPFSIIMSDLDHFSNVNNTYGHVVGDVVLKKFCSTAKSVIRSVDILTRYGGEEFVIILPNSDLENAYFVAEKIRDAVEKLKFKYKETVFSITSSFGVAEFKESDSIKSLIQRSDKALYKAKEKRNCTVKDGD